MVIVDSHYNDDNVGSGANSSVITVMVEIAMVMKTLMVIMVVMVEYHDGRNFITQYC